MSFNTSATIELLDKLSPQLRKIHDNFVKFESKIKNLKGTFEALNKVSGLSNMAKGAQMASANIAKITVAATAAAAATAGIAGMGIKGVVDTAAKFEDLSATLEAVEGSAEKAKAGLAWVQKFSKDTPFELDQVSEAFVRAKAYGIDPMDGSFKAIGDAASTLNKPIMDAVEAMADALTGENERLKEFGIKASKEGDKITYSWNKNGKQMVSTADANSQEQIKKTISGIWNEKYKGAMEKKSKTFNGMWSNMLDTYTIFQKQIADAGAFDAIKLQLKNLMDVINTPVVSASLDKLAKTISSKITGLMKGLGFDVGAKDANKFASMIDRLNATLNKFDAEKFGKKVRETVAKIKEFVDKVGLGNIALAGLAVMFAPTIVGLGQIALGFGKAATSAVKFATDAKTIESVKTALTGFQNMGGITGLLSRFGGAASAALAPFAVLGLPAIAVVAALAAAALLIWKYWDVVASFFKGFWQGFIDEIKPVTAALAPLKPIFDWIVKAVKGLFTQTKSTSAELKKAASIGQMFGQVVGGAVNLITGPLRFVIWLAQKLGEGIAWLVIKFGELSDWASQKLDEISATIKVVTKFFSETWDNAIAYVQSVFERLKNAALDKLKPIQTFLDGIISKIRSALESLGILDAKQAGMAASGGNFVIKQNYQQAGVTAPIKPLSFPTFKSPAPALSNGPRVSNKVDVHVSGSAKVDKVVTNGKSSFPLNPKAGLRS